MTTASVITGCLNGIVLALTPVERWEAARKFNSSIAQRWFILIAVVAIVILTALLAVISFNRTRRERKAAEKLFVEYAEKRGLTARERQILLSIANKAGLKRNESIFTLAGAFDRGADKMTEDSRAQQEPEQCTRLRTGISFLREKLGFQKRPFTSIGSVAKSKKMSSRNIPVGKKLHIIHHKICKSNAIEAIIIKNDDTELTVKLPVTIESPHGESWRVRYYFGASVWEFDTSMVSCDGNILVLNHSDNVRFINRRRFLRVPVKKTAFIARFPFAKSSEQVLEPPEFVPFVPAVVTEMGGPGLRIESSLKINTGERILVVFNLEETGSNKKTSRIIQDIAIARTIGDVKRREDKQEDLLSIAVELTGMRDADINELMRATNEASIRVNDKNKEAADSDGTEEPADLPVAAQGV